MGPRLIAGTGAPAALSAAVSGEQKQLRFPCADAGVLFSSPLPAKLSCSAVIFVLQSSSLPIPHHSWALSYSCSLPPQSWLHFQEWERQFASPWLIPDRAAGEGGHY